MSEPRQTPSRSKQDYGTPWAFIRACEARWGTFDIDLAAHADNAKAPAYLSPKEDSLSVPWGAHFRSAPTLAWLNPPFGEIEQWAAKCAEETLQPSSLRIIMLTPASIGTVWFREHVHRKALVLGVGPRLTFEGATDPYPKDLMLSLFGLGEVGFDVWWWTS
jgi:phage N-6-adenine-methyltransferase